MNDHGERVDFFAGDQDIEADHGGNTVARQVVVERSITARHGLQAVVEIENDFIQGQFVDQHHATGADVFELLLDAPLVFHQSQDSADVLFAGNHGGVNYGFFDLLDGSGMGKTGRVIDFQNLTVGGGDLVPHAGRGGDQIDVEFAFEAFLNDFEVEQTKEAAAEAEAEGDGAFRVIGQRTVIELEFFESVAEETVFVRFHGVQPGEHHGSNFFEAGEGLGSGVRGFDDGVTDLGVGHGLDVGVDVADLSCRQLGEGDCFGRLVA